MPESDIIITAVNDLYFPLAMDLIQSLLAFQKTRSVDIGILDVGLSASGQKTFQELGITIKTAGIDIEYQGRVEWEDKMPFIRAMTSRPFLPNYFPGYCTYMWMDSDTWL